MSAKVASIAGLMAALQADNVSDILLTGQQLGWWLDDASVQAAPLSCSPAPSSNPSPAQPAPHLPPPLTDAGDASYRFGDAPDRSVLPIRLDSRNLTIAGPGEGEICHPSYHLAACSICNSTPLAAAPTPAVAYNSSANWQVGQPGVPRLNFSHLWPVLVVGSNSSLTLRDVALECIAPYNTPDVAQSGYAQPRGWLVIYPSVVPEDGSQVGVGWG